MKTTPNEIDKCDHCEAPVPLVFLKQVGADKLCHPCFANGFRARGQVDDFFAGKTARQLARLRRAVPKFTEPSPEECGSKAWPEAFTLWSTRKASWYGFRDVFEFFAECMK